MKCANGIANAITTTPVAFIAADAVNAVAPRTSSMESLHLSESSWECWRHREDAMYRLSYLSGMRPQGHKSGQKHQHSVRGRVCGVGPVPAPAWAAMVIGRSLVG